MPTFIFTSPNGTKIQVTGPEGATPEQAFEIAKGRPEFAAASAPASSPAGPSTSDLSRARYMDPRAAYGMVQSKMPSPTPNVPFLTSGGKQLAEGAMAGSPYGVGMGAMEMSAPLGLAQMGGAGLAALMEGGLPGFAARTAAGLAGSAFGHTAAKYTGMPEWAQTGASLIGGMAGFGASGKLAALLKQMPVTHSPGQFMSTLVKLAIDNPGPEAEAIKAAMKADPNKLYEEIHGRMPQTQQELFVAKGMARQAQGGKVPPPPTATAQAVEQARINRGNIPDPVSPGRKFGGAKPPAKEYTPSDLLPKPIKPLAGKVPPPPAPAVEFAPSPVTAEDFPPGTEDWRTYEPEPTKAELLLKKIAADKKANLNKAPAKVGAPPTQTADPAPTAAPAPLASSAEQSLPGGKAVSPSPSPGTVRTAHEITDAKRRLFATAQELELAGHPAGTRVPGKVMSGVTEKLYGPGKTVSKLTVEEMGKIHDFMVRHDKLPEPGAPGFESIPAPAAASSASTTSSTIEDQLTQSLKNLGINP